MRGKPKFTPARGSIRNDFQELAKLNKRVQNKQSYIRVNKGLEVTSVQTKKMTDFESRDDFNKYKKEMESFMNRGADFKVKNVHGVQIDYSDVLYGEKVARRINAQKAKQWEEVRRQPFTNRGYRTGMTVEERADPRFGMGDVRYADFKPIQFDPNSYDNKNAFERRLKTIEDVYDRPNWLSEVNELYRENYILALENQLGSMSNDIQEHVKNMSLNEFIKHYYTENNAHIKFVYDRMSAEIITKELERVWGMEGNEEE